MAWLSSLARSGARATGRALSRHVVPDSLIPSWKTQKIAASGYSLLKKATRKAGSKKKDAPSLKGKPYKSAALARVARPAPKAPKQQFDKNGWSMGRTMQAPLAYDGPPRLYSNSPLPSRTKPRPDFVRQSRDLVRNPRLYLEMQRDLAEVEYFLAKKRVKSEFADAKNRFLSKKKRISSIFKRPV